MRPAFVRNASSICILYLCMKQEKLLLSNKLISHYVLYVWVLFTTTYISSYGCSVHIIVQHVRKWRVLNY